MSTQSRLNGGVSRSICLAAASAAVCMASAAFATDRAFTGTAGTPGDYNTAGNWNPTGVPVAGDKAIISGGRIASISSGTDVADSASFGTDGANVGSGELRISAGSLSVAGSIQLGHDAGTTGPGQIGITGGSLTAGQVVMGEQGTGDNKITLSAGSLTLNNESFIGANGNGSLLISGTGAASVQRINVANALGSTGVVTVSGGALNMNGDSYVGLRGFGTMNISGGTVNSNAKIALGQENDTGNPAGSYPVSRGVMNVTGGTTSLGLIVMGEQSRGDNQLNVSAGTLTLAGDLYGAANGVGTVNLSGTGTINVGAQYHMGAGTGSNGTLVMTGGTFNVINSYFLVGQNGTGTMTFSGGNINSRIFSVGQDPTGFGTGTQTGGAIRSTATFIVGESTSSNNTYSISGGSLDISTAAVDPNGNGMFIGSGHGKGTLNVSGTASVINENGVTVGYGEGGASDGTLNISGGIFKTTSTDSDEARIRIGVFAGSTGRLNVTGGTVTFAGPILNGVSKQDETVFNSGLVGGTGLITVGGGTLNAANMENATGSSYTQTAGTATLGQVVGGGTFAVSGGTANVSRITQSSLSVTGTGSVKVANVAAASRTASVVGSLTTGGTGKLDLGNNGLVVDYTGATSPIASVRAALKAGQIVGTLSPVDARQGVAYAEASAISATSLFGTPVDTTAVVVRTLLKGDANFSGNVNFDDLVILAQNYNTTGKVWTQGDFTYDGTVNFDDLVPLAQNYNGSVALLSGLSTSFQADFALAQSLVPEPTSLVAIAASAGLVGRRRRAV